MAWLQQVSSGSVLTSCHQLNVSAAIPTWQSECAKPEKRGRLIITSGAVIVAGVMISYWVTYGFYFLPSGESYSSVRWRFPIAFQSFFTVLVMYVKLFPRHVVLYGVALTASPGLASVSYQIRHDGL
jgi:hypothetical protein